MAKHKIQKLDNGSHGNFVDLPDEPVFASLYGTEGALTRIGQLAAAEGSHHFERRYRAVLAN